MVERNRKVISNLLPSEPVWLEQTHGDTVVIAENVGSFPLADASVSFQKNVVCTVMTADCLPVLLCDQSGSVVAAVHAGWRGLANGIIEKTIKTMGCSPDQLISWLGPAIGPAAFEVGEDVKAIFLQHNIAAERAFIVRGDKYLADIYLLARQRLKALGVTQIYGGDFCTFNENERFFSYRREGQTGRMATMIWRI